jgi:ketosteroid isomerase-like protein
MSTLQEAVARYLSLLESGQTVQAIEQFYDEEVVVFENRELARAGKRKCLEYEQQQLAALPAPPTFQVHAHAVNPETGDVFFEYTVRFTGANGRAMRLEEVAVQRWSKGTITEERFYYEGVVDEGDTEDDVD